MSQLTDAVKALEVRYEASDSEEWVRYECPHGGFRYVIHSRLADGYLAWCETENMPAPEWYLTAAEAIKRISEERVGASDDRETPIGAASR